jgi:hypothetical protein
MYNKAYSIIMFFTLQADQKQISKYYIFRVSQADQKQISKDYIFRVSVLGVSEKTLCSNFIGRPKQTVRN